MSNRVSDNWTTFLDTMLDEQKKNEAKKRIEALEAQNKEQREALLMCYCAISGFEDTNPLAEESVLHQARLKAAKALGFTGVEKSNAAMKDKSNEYQSNKSWGLQGSAV